VSTVIICTFTVYARADTIKAQGSVELTDPSGDVNPITTNAAPYPGYDVVKVNLDSDGKLLKIKITLNDPPHNFASAVIDLYIDVDNDPNTGIQLMFFKDEKGFEYKAALDSCIKFDNGMNACTGGTGKAKVLERYGSIEMNQFTGESENDKKTVISALGFPGKKASQKTPIKGKVVEGEIEYADLGVKPGQTIRVLIRESCGPIKPSSLFPEVLLTLN
jgi:hypothetical protein